nr:phage tail tape measure protein [Cellulomonas sp. APG4]
MESTGRSILKISAAVAIGLGLATKSAIDWEAAWAGVRKTVDGSPEEMAQLETELRGLAKTLPATHEEIAGVAEAAGQLGVKRKDVADFTRTMINMGETTNLTADEAATSIAQFSNIMGIGADQADRLGSSIVQLGNNGASTERDILAMGLRIAGAGRTVGLTADQVLAMASALSSVGIEAEAGGTAISQVMLKVDKDVAAGADTVAEYARVAGVSADEFSRKWGQDAAGALTLFLQGLARMQSQGGNTTEALEGMGFTGIRVTDTLRRASLASDQVTSALQHSSEAWAENNALAAEAAKRYETTEARLQIARNQINDAAIDIGANFLPVVANATSAVGTMAEGFSTLTPAQQSWVANLGAAAAGLGTVVGGAAIVIPKLKELSETVTALQGGSSRLGRALGGTASVLAGPWGLALAGATVALGAWMHSQGEAKQRVDELRASLDEATGAVTGMTREVVAQRLVEKPGFWDTNKLSGAEAAKRLGIELSVVTDAIAGTAEEAAAANEILDGFLSPGASRRAEGMGLSMQEWVGATNALRRELTGGSEDLATARQEAEYMREAVGETAAATDGAAGSQSAYNTELAEGEGIVEQAAAAVDDLTRALDELNGPALTAREAERRMQEAIDAVTASIENNGTTLDINTEKGRANNEVLDGLARAGMAHAQAVLEQTGDVEAFTATMDASRQELANAAIQFGMTSDEAWAFVESVLAVPDEATVQATFEKTQAESNMQAFVDHWSGYGIPMSVNLNADAALSRIQTIQRRLGVSVMQADGGVVEYYAAGGIREHHVAQIAPAGARRVWAEPETDGEGYIPFAMSKRARSEAVLGEIARRFGGAYITRADQIAPHISVTAPTGGTSADQLAAALDGVAFTLVTEAGPIRAIARAEVTSAQASRRHAMTQGVR